MSTKKVSYTCVSCLLTRPVPEFIHNDKSITIKCAYCGDRLIPTDSVEIEERLAEYKESREGKG